MLISLFSPKGGTGCSVAASLFSVSLARFLPTMLVDACEGDLHAIAALDIDIQYSFHDWCESSHPTSESLEKISRAIEPNLTLIPSSNALQEKMREKTYVPPIFLSFEKRSQIVNALTSYEGHCVVDLGRREDSLASDIVRASDIVIIALKQCYLSLNAAIHHPFTLHADGCLVIQESGRSIAVDDIAKTLSIEKIIEVQARRDFVRAIDAGVLFYRTPEHLQKPIDAFVHDMMMEEDNNNQQPHDVFAQLSHKSSTGFWSRNELQEKPLRSYFSFLPSKRWLS